MVSVAAHLQKGNWNGCGMHSVVAVKIDTLLGSGVCFGSHGAFILCTSDVSFNEEVILLALKAADKVGFGMALCFVFEGAGGSGRM
jgi:hypothetical protein